jgi:hypothetical protein
MDGINLQGRTGDKAALLNEWYQGRTLVDALGEGASI